MKNVKRRRAGSQAGITLIEMLVVVTIIALFAALVAPKMFNQADNGYHHDHLDQGQAGLGTATLHWFFQLTISALMPSPPGWPSAP